MREFASSFDAIIIGGGFYGASIAIYLARTRGMQRILLVEREAALLQRASYNNQARVHNGYHYPRSFTTAYRSRVNRPRFVTDWPQAIYSNFTKLYAIARRHSKVTASQFERFCRGIGAQADVAPKAYAELFAPQLIEQVYCVEESAFDATQLAAWAQRQLQALGVHTALHSVATHIHQGPDAQLHVRVTGRKGQHDTFSSPHVFNCTYSGLNQFSGDFPGTQRALKHEIAEMAWLKVPEVLRPLGITVMDGPFFSMMPFPPRSLHTLSHVRYTPTVHWADSQQIAPYAKLQALKRQSRVHWMLRDVARYLPCMAQANYVESMYEVKTILSKNEGDDGRPILFEKHVRLPGCYSILGGKIDNIYDVLQKLDSEVFLGA